MSLSRALRKTIARLLIGVLLFAQLALASYACPSLKGMGASANAGAAVAVGMPPGCGQMDPELPNLCAEHCRQGQQSADTAAAPAVNPGILTLLYSMPMEPQRLLASGRSFPAPDACLAATPEPPHAILHCVFRI